MEIKVLLNKEIADEIKQLNGIEVGTEEYKTTVDELVKLIDRSIEMEKIENELVTRQNQADTEVQFKNEQAKREERDRLIKNCIAVAGLIIPSVLTIWGTVKSFEFERDGSITTIMGRGFINKLLPKK